MWMAYHIMTHKHLSDVMSLGDYLRGVESRN